MPRSNGLLAGLYTALVLMAIGFAFLFSQIIEQNYLDNDIDAVQEQTDEYAIIANDLQSAMNDLKSEIEEAKKSQESADGAKSSSERRAAAAKEEATTEYERVGPARMRFKRELEDKMTQIESVLRAMEDNRSSFETTENQLLEEIRLKVAELRRRRDKHKELAYVLDTDIGKNKAKVRELENRLDILKIESRRGRTITDVGGEIIALGSEETNFAAINLGAADRMRKGLKFTVWSPRRGYGLAWVTVKGRDFVREGVLAGDVLTIGRGQEAVQYPIVSVGISRTAAESGSGLAGAIANDTLRILGPGLTDVFYLASYDWKIDRPKGKAPSLEDLGVVVKGMIEVTSVRMHSSDVVILPERTQKPICPQCGWTAWRTDMKYCVFCFKGESEDQLVALDRTVIRKLNQGQDPLRPVMMTDRLSNPFFSPNRQLVFVLGTQSAKKTRQHIQAFIEHNGGKVVEPMALLGRPEENSTVVYDVQPYEINYAIPGVGPESDELLRRARELGIRTMSEDDLYEFFGEVD